MDSYSVKISNKIIMRYFILVSLLIVGTIAAYGQTPNPNVTEKKSKVGWYVTPEVGAMFLKDHVGTSLGATFGLKFWKDRIKFGAVIINRPGPLNSATFKTQTANNTSYLGRTSFDLRADWAMFGATLAPVFKLKDVEINVPISFGGAAGGFYLHGDDRKTPDGDRVSVWENKLFTAPGLDEASGGGWTEFGVQTFFPTKVKGMQIGAGVHYMLISGFKTYNDPNNEMFNQKLRASVLINFGSY
jgi:hypothetical protein